MWVFRQEAARSREVESEKYLKDKEQIIEMASWEKREFFRPSGAGSWGRFSARTPTRSLALGISEEPRRAWACPGIRSCLLPQPFQSHECPELLWTLIRAGDAQLYQKPDPKCLTLLTWENVWPHWKYSPFRPPYKFPPSPFPFLFVWRDTAETESYIGEKAVLRRWTLSI